MGLLRTETHIIATMDVIANGSNYKLRSTIILKRYMADIACGS